MAEKTEKADTALSPEAEEAPKPGVFTRLVEAVKGPSEPEPVSVTVSESQRKDSPGTLSVTAITPPAPPEEDQGKEPKTPPARYRVKRGIAVRKQPEFTCEEFLNWEPGQTFSASSVPAHMDLDGLLAIDAIELITPKKPEAT